MSTTPVRSILSVVLRVGVLLAVLVWFVTRPQNPSTVTSGGFNINGRLCHYSVADGRIEYVLLFDSNWLRGTSRAALGGGRGSEMFLESASGWRFSMTYTDPSSVVIDGQAYRLDEGVVFLLRRTPDGNRCQQLPTTFGGGMVQPMVDAEEHVHAALQRACADTPELAAFLGP